MNFSKFWPKRSRKESSNINGDYLGYDLFYQLSYMSSIAAAGLPRSQIFEFAAQLPCSSSRYFAEINLLCKQMRYDYAVACRIVGESAKEESVKSLLLRLSSSLGSGEPESEFLAQEAKIQAEAFKNEYERGVESLRKWTEAYAALIVSAALIVMVAAISMLIYPVAIGITVALVGVTIMVSILGAWAIYRVSPKEVRVHNQSLYCPAHRRARQLAGILLPIAVAAFFVLVLIGAGLGWGLMVAGVLMLPVGVAGLIFDRQVTKKDTDISTFLRSLGNVASAIGITVSNALDRLDLRSTANLSGDVKRLRSRLISRLRPELCWQRFSVETGSETIYRSVKMFHDATRLGGDPEEVGGRSSLIAMSLDFLRAKRGQVSSSFVLLVLGMHAALVALLLFVVQVLNIFSKTVEGVYTQAVEGAPSGVLDVFGFSFENVHILGTLVLPVILVMAGANAFAIKAADGGNRFKLFVYLGVTLSLSGAALVFVPIAASKIFSSIPAVS
ncbi:MAG: archaellar assembly protein FlaJ [Chloroflexi bacterium]|nr:archaellar assembly protein FlaJ [Chloroflexota bacterium]